MSSALSARSSVRATLQRLEARAPRNIRRALHRVRTELYIQRLHGAAVKKAAASTLTTPLRLNLGSGFHPKPGWVNVNLADDYADLQLDLREPLPFPRDSAEAIYSEHFFEHLSYANLDDPNSWSADATLASSEALRLLRECHRVLRPGGRLDLVVPDAESILDAYAARRRKPFVAADWWGPAWCDTPMHQVNYLFRQGSEHQYAYDFDTLRHTLEGAGFREVVNRGFDPELDGRNATRSLFVRACKPRD